MNFRLNNWNIYKLYKIPTLAAILYEIKHVIFIDLISR
jgi:hypothetical protein